MPKKLFLFSILVWGLMSAARADEIKVLSAGAFKPLVLAVAEEFTKRSGHELRVENDTAGALQRRIEGGEAFDVAVLPTGTMEALTKSGRIVPGSSRPLARVAVGVAVKEGAPMPDISSVAAFRRALLEARAVAYIDPAAGGSSGIYLSRLFADMGVADQVGAKAILVPGGLVARRLLTGEADLAIHQISEILAVPGVTLVGPLPAEVQNYTTYAGGLATESGHGPAGRAMLDYLSGGQMDTVLKSRGMEAPPR